MGKVVIGDLGTRALRAWKWPLTTYFGVQGFLRLKAKPSGRSVITPDGDFQVAARVQAIDATGAPEIVKPRSIQNEAGVSVWVGDIVYVWLTVWMTDICHVYVVEYPTGSLVATGAAEREGEAVAAAHESMRVRGLSS